MLLLGTAKMILSRQILRQQNNYSILRSLKFIKRSSTTNAANLNAVKSNLKRPLSPHLSIYQPQLTWLMSIAHRVTGAGLAVGIYGGGMIYAVAPFTSTSIVALVAATPGILLFLGKLILTVPYTYHFYNGLRHLAWDLRYTLSLKAVYATGYAVTGATILTSLYLSAL